MSFKSLIKLFLNTIWEKNLFTCNLLVFVKLLWYLLKIMFMIVDFIKIYIIWYDKKIYNAITFIIKIYLWINKLQLI